MLHRDLELEMDTALYTNLFPITSTKVIGNFDENACIWRANQGITPSQCLNYKWGDWLNDDHLALIVVVVFVVFVQLTNNVILIAVRLDFVMYLFFISLLYTAQIT